MNSFILCAHIFIEIEVKLLLHSFSPSLYSSCFPFTYNHRHPSGDPVEPCLRFFSLLLKHCAVLAILSPLGLPVLSCWMLFCCENPREMHRADIQSEYPKQRRERSHLMAGALLSSQETLIPYVSGELPRSHDEGQGRGVDPLYCSFWKASTLPADLEIPQDKEKCLTVIQCPFLEGRALASSLLLQGLFLSFNVIFYVFFDM